MELIQAIWQCLTGTASAGTLHALGQILLLAAIPTAVYVLATWIDRKSRREPPDNSAAEQGWFHAPEPRDWEEVWPPPPKGPRRPNV